MKIDKKYIGKWIAIKNNRVIESENSLTKLTRKIEKRIDKNSLRFTLVPNGLIAG